jgi:hypothetical protein
MTTRVFLLVCFALAATVAAWWFVRAPKDAREDAAAVGAPRSDERSIAPSELGAPAVTAELVRAPVAAGDVEALDEYRLRGEDGTAAPLAVVEVYVGRGEEAHDFDLVASLVADASGRFEFAHARGGFPLVIAAQEHADLSRSARAGVVSLESPPDGDVRVVLDDERPSTYSAPVEIKGRVLFPDGSPAVSALVFITAPDHAVRTDEAGEFVLPWQRTTRVEQSSLFARHVDGGLVRDAEFGARLAASLPDAPWPTTLVLPGDAGRIVGRLVDSGGPPPAGWRISIQDPTPTGHSTAHVEPHGAASDHDGRFVLTQLDPGRAYRLALTAPGHGAVLLTEPIRPRPDVVEIEVGDGVFAHDVTGRALSLGGDPLGDVTLRLVVDVLRVAGGDGGGSVSMSAWGYSTRTGPDGSFRFERVPRVGVEVEALGSADVPLGRLRAWLDPLADSRILRFDRLVPVLPIAAAAKGTTLRVRALDETDSELVLLLVEPGSWTTSPAMPLGAEIWVSELARTLVLEEWSFGARGGPTIVERQRAAIGGWAGPGSGPIRIDFGGE